MRRYGRIDILVNNVGGSLPGTPVSLSVEDWDAQMDRNLKTAFLGCKHVIPVMERQFDAEGRGGAIVNVSSIAQHELPGRRPRSCRLCRIKSRTGSLWSRDCDRVREEGNPRQHGGRGHDAHTARVAPPHEAARCRECRGPRSQAKCPDSDGPHGRCLGYRARSAVPRQRRSRIHHRDATRGRRGCHGRPSWRSGKRSRR